MEQKGIQLFSNDEFGSVRTIVIDDEVWFVGKDVAKILGYSNPQKALRDNVDEEDKTVNHQFTVNGTMGMLISESGLYNLVIRSKLPSAKRFRRWITSEVLPAIRKNGGYIMTTPDMSDMEIMARGMLVAQKTIEEKDKIIESQNEEIQRKDNKINSLATTLDFAKPFIAFAAGVRGSETNVDFAEYAAYLQNDYDIDIGRNALMQFCRDRGYLCGKQKEWNRPSQKMISQGYMSYAAIPIKINGKRTIKFKPTLTGKGQFWLYKQVKQWYGSQNYEDEILKNFTNYGV